MRAEKKDTGQRRKEIAQAALEVMSRHGLRGLSIAAVARRVGLSPSAIYRHYTGKDQMLDAALDHLREVFLGNVAAGRAETEDPMERLRAVVRRHLAFFLENIALPRIIFSDESIAARPHRRARVYGIVRDYLGAIAEIIRDGQDRGLLGRRVDPETGALLFMGTVQPAGFLRLLSGGEFDIAAHLERAWPLYEQLLLDTGPEPGRRTKGAAVRASRVSTTRRT
ncbi:MAG: TetR/AcrR family transcriptional regulator [Hyphomicrobiales bacterium]